MLTSQCVASTNWLVSTGSVICYTASMANFFLFTNEKCSSYQHWTTWGHKIRRLAIQKLNHLASDACKLKLNWN